MKKLPFAVIEVQGYMQDIASFKSCHFEEIAGGHLKMARFKVSKDLILKTEQFTKSVDLLVDLENSISPRSFNVDSFVFSFDKRKLVWKMPDILECLLKNYPNLSFKGWIVEEDNTTTWIDPVDGGMWNPDQDAEAAREWDSL